MTIAELNEYLRKTIPIFTASGNMHGRLTFNNINTAYNTGAIVLGDHPRREHPENEGLIMHIHSRYSPVRIHTHDYFEMMYVRSGTVTHHIDEREIVLHSGDFLMLAPGTKHYIDNCEENDIAINFLISISYLTPSFMSLISQNQLFYGFIMPHLNSDKSAADNDKSESGLYIKISAKDCPDILELTDKMLCEFFDPDICSGNILKCSFPNLLNLLFRVWKINGGSIRPRKNMNDEDILQVIKYVESNYAAASLKDAAARFGYNPDYLSRLIKSKLGISFGEMKHNVCLAQAKALLVCTDLSISEIAQQVGFSNMSFFYSLFNKYFQTTPAEFRKSK